VILPTRSFAAVIVVALAAGISGCGGGLTLPSDATPSDIKMVTGDAQAGIVGSVLPLPLVVKVTDKLGRAVASQNVTFTIESGGGQVSPASATTGADGRASATWTLGPDAGNQAVQAQAVGGGAPDNLVQTFTAMAVAGSGQLIAAVSGNEQNAAVNSALADSLVVKVSDGSNNPVSGITVQWTAVGGGSVSPETVVTGTDGRAATARVLGPTSGQQSAQAAADGLAGSPVTFVHTALASNPTTLTIVSGSGQTAPAGFEVADDLVVKVTDTDGNGVGGVAVTWLAAAGSGNANPQNSSTDPTGFAHSRWTLGAVAGPDSLTAVVSGITPVRFGATASADVPTKIALQSGNNQSAVGGQDLPNPLAVKVTDANDNPVENVSVTWNPSVGGTVSSPTSATNAQGIAQITRTLGLAPGTYTTTADVPGLTGTPITFTSTATVGPAAKIVVTTEPGATAVNGVTISPQPVVQVQDAAGNNVGPAGRTITADLINSPGPGLNGDKTKDTDAGGQAVYTDLNITGPVGSYTIRFRSGSLIAATSTAIAVTAGAPSAGQSSVAASPTSVAAGDPSTITVIAKDAGGNPVSGVTVTLSASGSGNSLTQPAAQTDASGQTTGSFSSTSTGSHTITATMNGTTTVSNPATVTVTAGPPASIAINAGNGQTAAAGSAVSTDPSVVVKDVGGNPVSGVQVTFAVASGGGSVTGATPTTNGSGIATVGSWTLGSTAGTNNNTLTATATGTGISGNPVTFTASASAGAPTQIAITTQPSGSAQAGVALATQPAVQLKDAGGNNSSASGVTITATIASGPGGSNLSNATATTSGGVATFSGLSIDGPVGSYTLNFDSGSLTGATSSSITVSAGPAAQLSFTTEPPALVLGPSTAFTVVVAVSDGFGNPTDATVDVTLNQPSGGTALLGGTTNLLSVGGSASFSNLTVSQPNGFGESYSLTASASGATSTNSSSFIVTP
jgi:adhesin/invasin